MLQMLLLKSWRKRVTELCEFRDLLRIDFSSVPLFDKIVPALTSVSLSVSHLSTCLPYLWHFFPKGLSLICCGLGFPNDASADGVWETSNRSLDAESQWMLAAEVSMSRGQS